MVIPSGGPLGLYGHLITNENYDSDHFHPCLQILLTPCLLGFIR